ncbi:alpha-amylase family glycosyl hydrolase [Stygiobacter electus]|uniref:Alpha-amylase family glycosyl hydrolase n=1 Tax=Stygiobacter electus TaxID=3032292 RepID=A0AAE3P498_9BACT|nr:alpha-amylase family glycosyl hydrolase [Stygiobacter electus]MDF1612640.1 alpha-amylase family glycosyl hydrolase [Stygiobacter electus]
MKLKLTFIVLFLPIIIFSQTTFSTNPQYPVQTDKITITFDVKNATHQNKIAGYTGKVYAHTGVTLKIGNGTQQRWQNVIGNWGDNNVQPELTRISTDVYQITINNPRNFYKVTDSNTKITELCFVIRSSDGTKQTEDIFVPIYFSGLNISFDQPKINVQYNDPMRSPYFVKTNDTINISVSVTEVGTKLKTAKLYVNGIEKSQTSTNQLTYKYIANNFPSGKNEIKVVAIDTLDMKDSSTIALMKNPEIKNLPLPTGNDFGINYQASPTEVILALYAPQKKFIYVIGDFNDWKVDTTYFLNRYEVRPDSVIWWIKLTNLSPAREYSFQYFIDGEIRVADPYTDKILDPNNDRYISTSTYPNLKTYPDGLTSEIVSVFQTAQNSYNWKTTNFTRPSKEKLVVYELLVRDFTNAHTFKAIRDSISYFKKLGINAIELMPINEFEGNNSWGYNPSFYFAVDKYYGPKYELKALIDECHANGIAVLMDIVLNHAYGSNPMVRMYFEKTTGKPASNNPWFNQQSNFANPDAQWGYDFNHESKATQYFVDRVIKYWLTEYKFDGFRFDFTKGFGNNYKPMSDPWGSNYDADRIRLLKRMVSKAWSYDPTSIMIFEHLAVNSEEKELADYGILLWGNMNYNYSEAAMGYNDSGKSNIEGVSYLNRGWTKPNLVAYMESHDEERLMYKNLTYGNSLGTYNVKNLETALQRMKTVGAFFFTVPGPKMIWQFGELGYDYSIDYNGRLGTKPVRWDYLNNLSRLKLFKTWAALIKLKTDYPAFSSNDFKMSATGYLKRMWINHSTMNVVVVANYGLFKDTMIPEFQNAGKWYDYFSGSEINISNKDTLISLEPGEFKIFTTQKLPTPESGITTKIEMENSLPNEFVLEQNYPNPFNPSTILKYSLPESGYVTLKVYDILGREVANLVNEYQKPGTYSTEFRAQSSELSSGVYFYRLNYNGQTLTRKMILAK